MYTKIKKKLISKSPTVVLIVFMYNKFIFVFTIKVVDSPLI